VTTTRCRAAHRFLDELEVERGNGAQVDHFGLNRLRCELPGRSDGAGNGDAVGRDGNVTAGPTHSAATERHEILGAADLAAQAGEELVHQEDHRILPAQRRLDEPLRIGGRRRHRYEQPGRVREPRLETVVVLRAATRDPVRPPDH